MGHFSLDPGCREKTRYPQQGQGNLSIIRIDISMPVVYPYSHKNKKGPLARPFLFSIKNLK